MALKNIGDRLVQDLSYSIQPKSDQLNADDLIGSNKTLVVTEVIANNSPDQPVIIHYQDDNGRPYKPCKSMRRILIHAWGADGTQWPGRAMVVYRDDSVKWAGQEVGGIRISHLSHIDKPITIALTATRGQRKKTTIQKMEYQGGTNSDDIQKYKDALSLAVGGGLNALADAWSKIPGDVAPKLVDHKDQCKAQIQGATQQPEQQGFTPAQSQQPEQQQNPQQQAEPAAVATDPSQL